MSIPLVRHNAVRVLPMESARAVMMAFTVSSVNRTVLATAPLDVLLVDGNVGVAKKSADAI